MSETQTLRRPPAAVARPQLGWIDVAKAVGISWIFLNHISEQLFGGEAFSNPTPNWGSLHDRVSQLKPLSVGLWTIPANLLRWVGWSGDQGVQLFLIASGAGLTWSLLRSASARLRPVDFYRKRLARILPLWIGAHLAFLGPAILLQGDLRLTDRRFWMSLAGLRVTSGSFYYFAAAWWYMTLLLQLYLVFPLLWSLLRRYGPAKFLGWSCVIGFTIRAIGLYTLGSYLDPFQRGSIFVTRLPEFALGMAVAAWIYNEPTKSERYLRSRRAVAGALACYAVGFALAFTLPGMAVSPLLLGAGAIHIIYVLSARWSGSAWTRGKRHPLRWLANHSFSLYLVHQPIVDAFLPAGRGLSADTLLRVVLVALLTIAAALCLEGLVVRVISIAGRIASHRGRSRLLLAGAATAVVALLIPATAEALVRAHNPQEALGWGERPSLIPDDQFGWKLRPSQTTHLRWASYDYRVTSNALGFPAPEYPAPKPAGTLRVMTIGDAFTSAEGVDTNQSWARLLEQKLNTIGAGGAAQVLNFAITGYGPNQEAAVVNRYAPEFRPDVIVVQFFVWDFDEATMSNAEFQASIGFANPSPSSLRGFLSFPDLGQWFTIDVRDRLADQLLGRTAPNGYFLGNFKALERGRISSSTQGAQLLAERYAAIKSTADSLGAKVVVMMVPAPVQVCQPKNLDYFPNGINLADSQRFDLDQPQRVLKEITGRLSIPTYDLRSVLASASSCPYQRNNIHWTTVGHTAVADFLAKQLPADGLISR